jgi:membrane protease YdiL (CAAX protease family)
LTEPSSTWPSPEGRVPEPDDLTEPDAGAREEGVRVPEPGAASDMASAAPVRERFGLTTFALEGRRAPALFAVGWLGTISGVALITMTLLGAAGLAALILSVAGFGALSVGTILLAGSQTIERKAAGAAYAGPSPLLIFVAVIATGRLAGYVVGIPLLAVADSIPPAIGDLLATLVLAVVFLGVLRLTVVGPGVLDWSAMGLRRDVRAAVRDALGGATYAIPIILVTSVVAVVAVQLAGVSPQSPLPPTGTTEGLFLHLLAGAVIAPFYEEVLFRGFALRVWLATHGARAAIIRSSLLFVIAHVLFIGADRFQDAVALAFVGAVVRIPVALTLGWLYVRTRALWAPIGLHAAFNGTLIVLAEVAVRATTG